MSSSYIAGSQSGSDDLHLAARTVTWTHGKAAGSSVQNDPTRVSLNDLFLSPGWYRVKVWTGGEDTVVSGRARFFEQRRADLRIRMEPFGKHCFQKTFKIAEPLLSLAIALEGEPGGSQLRKVTIHPLTKLSIGLFLGTKAVRYAISNRGRINWKVSWSHFKAALHPRANFAFRGRYDRPGDESYDKWQAVHEHQNTGIFAAKALDTAVGPTKIRIALLVASHVDAQALRQGIEASLIGSAVSLSVIERETLNHSPHVADFVIPLDYPGFFPNGAIEQLALELVSQPELAAVFADCDTMTADGTRKNPRLKPPWDPELLWCMDYIRAPVMMRWAPDLSPALELPGADEKPGYALSLTLLQRRRRQALGRIPAILFHELETDRPNPTADQRILEAHIAQLDIGAQVTVLQDYAMKVDWPMPAIPSGVSIIIPSKDNPALLEACIESILTYTTGVRYEIVIADNGSTQEKAKEYLKSVTDVANIKVVSLPGPFNFSKINNDARRHCNGNILVFLNDDTKVISGDWLSELVSLACREDVGAVGAMLLYQDGSVQHAGVLLGVGGPADHAFRYQPGESRGYLDLLRCRREVTAVTGACLAVSAHHFDAIGGFDEKLMVTCNDVDLCLRLRATGLTNIWTPWARLEHWESVSRGVDFTDKALQRQANELRIMSERWGDLMDRDPTYHPGLSDFAPDYSLSV